MINQAFFTHNFDVCLLIDNFLAISIIKLFEVDSFFLSQFEPRSSWRGEALSAGRFGPEILIEDSYVRFLCEILVRDSCEMPMTHVEADEVLARRSEPLTRFLPAKISLQKDRS